MILAVDPGKTTGIAVAKNVIFDTFDLWSVGDVFWVGRCAWFAAFFAEHHAELTHIIIERFFLYNNQRTMNAQINSDFPSVRIIGIVEAYAHLYGLQNKIVFQDASCIHGRSATTRRPKMLVTIAPAHQKVLEHASDHAKDAYRHLRYFVQINKHNL